MANRLRIASDFLLPSDAVARRLAILGMSGSGKSNAAVVLAEAMHAEGIPWVAIDPKGDWYGVRSSVDGKHPGLPVPILGGLHGDIPLEPDAGAYVADLIAGQRLTCVLDLSEFDTRQQMFKFAADLGERLLRVNREPIMLFMEEFDDLCPQKTGEKGHLARCKGVWQRVVKRGRFRGIGTVQISQRCATIDKDTLYQAEALIALRATGKGDRTAIAGWVEYHNAADEIVASLPTLADGEGWVSSPAWLQTTRRVRFLRRKTFDSGATPIVSGKRVQAATLADVDLDVIRTEMAATIERVQADDPNVLRARIKELERTIAHARAWAEEFDALVDPKVIERIKHSVQDLLATENKVRDKIMDGLIDIRQRAALMEQLVETKLVLPPGFRFKDFSDYKVEARTSTGRKVTVDEARGTITIGPRSGSDTVTRMGQVLASYGATGVTESQLATLVGCVPRGGSWNTNKKRLRERGWVEVGMDGGWLQIWRATPACFEAFPDAISDLPRTKSELLSMWASKPGMGPSVDLATEVVNSISIVPSAAAEALGVAPRGGSWNTRVQRAKRAGLIQTRDGAFWAGPAFEGLS